MIKSTLSRVRRNHGLEHATIHVLSKNHGGFSAQGNSNHRGFYLNIYGDVSEEAIVAAVHEAFTRMKNGEHGLAVHPNCGTVLLTTATMTTLAAQAAFGIEQMRQERSRADAGVLLAGLPSAIFAAVLAMITSKRLGMFLQERYTTEGDLGEMELLRIRKIGPTLTTRFFKLLLGQSADQSNAYFVETIN